MIALFATCQAQAFRPNLVRACLDLGRGLGLDLRAPKAQTCCGLMAWDAGQNEAVADAARLLLRVFDNFDAIIAPSPACLRMVRQHIPILLAGQPEASAAQALASRSFTFCEYLVQIGAINQLDLRFSGKIAFFPPCTADDDSAARQILGRIAGAELVPDPIRQCCGYGANLAWRHPHLSRAMAQPVVAALQIARANLVLTTEVGCLLHLDPLLRKANGPPIQHLIEFLAGA